MTAAATATTPPVAEKLGEAIVNALLQLFEVPAQAFQGLAPNLPPVFAEVFAFLVVLTIPAVVANVFVVMRRLVLIVVMMLWAVFILGLIFGV